MAKQQPRFVYRATCVPQSPGTCRVVAINLATREEEELAPQQRPGVHFHSPTGYAWGYFGSGPAQLAQDLLRHHTGREPHPALYQRFKADVIARYRIDAGWLLTGTEIDRWLEASAREDDWLDEDDMLDL